MGETRQKHYDGLVVLYKYIPACWWNTTEEAFPPAVSGALRVL